MVSIVATFLVIYRHIFVAIVNCGFRGFCSVIKSNARSSVSIAIFRFCSIIKSYSINITIHMSIIIDCCSCVHMSIAGEVRVVKALYISDPIFDVKVVESKAFWEYWEVE